MGSAIGALIFEQPALGPILDGIMRNTREGREFVGGAAGEGVRCAIERRDGRFVDYSQAARQQQPLKRIES